MEKITVEEYIEKYKRYMDLLIAKTPSIVTKTEPDGYVHNVAMFTKNLPETEEKELIELDKFLNSYHCEYQLWEDFSESSFLTALDIVKGEASLDKEYIDSVLNRTHPYMKDMFTNW